MSDNNFKPDEMELDEVFGRYRAACPDVEASPNFMPGLWQKIDARRTWWFHFGRLGKNALAMSAGLSLILLALNLVQPQDPASSYVDALLPDDSAEQVYTTEISRPAMPVPGAPQTDR